MDYENITWYPLAPSDFEGRGWKDTEEPFDRVPAKIKEALPHVWMWSRSPTGMCVFFNTDSTRFYVKYRLGEERIGEANFNVVAHCGMDMYVYDETQSRWRWGATAPHFDIKDQNPEYKLLDGIPKQMRRCRMYAPFRNRISDVYIGVDSDAEFELVPPRRTPPLVYYGTSIIHGAFAVRSGLGVAQILGRKLDMPLINLGFSGAAHLEKEMAELLAELDAGIFIIDPYHNIFSGELKDRVETFFDILCTAHPETPVFFVSAPQTLQGWLRPAEKAEQDEKTKLFNKYGRMLMKKYPNVHYIKGDNFYGSDEISMDGIHPNDEAFTHMSEILYRKISAALKQ